MHVMYNNEVFATQDSQTNTADDTDRYVSYMDQTLLSVLLIEYTLSSILLHSKYILTLSLSAYGGHNGP